MDDPRHHHKVKNTSMTSRVRSPRRSLCQAEIAAEPRAIPSRSLLAAIAIRRHALGLVRIDAAKGSTNLSHNASLRGKPDGRQCDRRLINAESSSLSSFRHSDGQLKQSPSYGR